MQGSGVWKTECSLLGFKQCPIFPSFKYFVNAKSPAVHHYQAMLSSKYINSRAMKVQFKIKGNQRKSSLPKLPTIYLSIAVQFSYVLDLEHQLLLLEISNALTITKTLLQLCTKVSEVEMSISIKTETSREIELFPYCQGWLNFMQMQETIVDAEFQSNTVNTLSRPEYLMLYQPGLPLSHKTRQYKRVFIKTIQVACWGQERESILSSRI